MNIFGSKQNVSSTGAQDKQSSNCTMCQQCPVLGKVPGCGVWLYLKLVSHLAEPSMCWNLAKTIQFLQTNTRMVDKSVKQSPATRI